MDIRKTFRAINDYEKIILTKNTFFHDVEKFEFLRHLAQNWEKQFNTLQNVKVLIYFQRLFEDLIESVELIVTSKPFLNVTNARNVVISF